MWWCRDRGVQPGRQDPGSGPTTARSSCGTWQQERNRLPPSKYPFCAVAGVQPGRQDLAWAGKEKTVKLWDLTAGKERATLSGHDSCVRFVRTAQTARPWPRRVMTRR